MMVLILGLGFYPLGSVLFSSLEDRGFIFSKVLGLGLSGFLTWVLVAVSYTHLLGHADAAGNRYQRTLYRGGGRDGR